MRRGLMGWNAEELPVATLEARLARLRAGMAKAGMDAFIIYTNNTRPSAGAYVTGFTPYWSDALLAGCRTGAPVFATSPAAPLADRVAVRASIGYRGCGVRRTRAWAKTMGAANGGAWFDGVVRSRGGRQPSASERVTKLKELPGASLTMWMAESCTGR